MSEPTKLASLRELDAWVEEKVMKVAKKPKPTIEELERILNEPNPPPIEILPSGEVACVPRYTTDPRAWMEVWEKVGHLRMWNQAWGEAMEGPCWAVLLTHGSGRAHVHAKPGVAVCLAACTAVDRPVTLETTHAAASDGMGT